MPAPDTPAMSTVDVASQQTLDFDGLNQVNFDPIHYLNETLPSLNLSSQPSSSKQTRSSQLQLASVDTQNILSKLSTHNVRTSTELTRLTDEILRNGNRLAYEVEVLRGDANNLYDVLTGELREEIQIFLGDTALQESKYTDSHQVSGNGQDSLEKDSVSAREDEPDFIKQLRTLTQIKSRLESVVSVFGEALKWPIPPSEVSVAASLISVSAPELGVANSAEDDQAREVTRQIRSEISELIASDGGGYTGIETASKRVHEFRDLTTVWKGTAEEKARTRVVDGFAKMVEDKRKALDTRTASARSNSEAPRLNSVQGRSATPSNPAAGLFRNLQKLRDEIYLE